MGDVVIAALNRLAGLTCALFTLAGGALANSLNSSDWQMTQAEAASLSDKTLSSIHQDIEDGRYGYIDALLIARHGKLIFEQYYGHDYSLIYDQEAASAGALVVSDPSGPYSYFSPGGTPTIAMDLHSMRSP